MQLKKKAAMATCTLCKRKRRPWSGEKEYHTSGAVLGRTKEQLSCRGRSGFFGSTRVGEISGDWNVTKNGPTNHSRPVAENTQTNGVNSERENKEGVEEATITIGVSDSERMEE